MSLSSFILLKPSWSCWLTDGGIIWKKSNKRSKRKFWFRHIPFVKLSHQSEIAHNNSWFPLSGLTTFNDFPANFQVITALKRSLGQGYVFTPVILFTGGMCIPACNGGVHPRANTPSPQGDTPKLFLFIFTTCVSFCSQRGLCPSMHHRSHDQGGLCPGGVWGVC